MRLELILIPFLVIGCAKNEKQNRTESKIAKTLDVSINEGGFGLVDVTDYSFDLQCYQSPGKNNPWPLISNYDGAELFGDLHDCEATITSFSTATNEFTRTPEGQYRPSGTNDASEDAKMVLTTPLPTPLAAGSNTAVYTLSQTRQQANQNIDNTLVVSNTATIIEGSLAPSYQVDRAEIVAINPILPGLEIDVSCTSCVADIRYELAIYEGETIDEALLQGLGNYTNSNTSGTAFTLEYSITDLINNIGLGDHSDLGTTDFIIAFKVDGESSYAYSVIRAVEPPKVIFATSNLTNGNLGGLSGADSLCSTAATAQGISGTFKAFISDKSTAARDRVTQSESGYVNVSGNLVFASFTELVSSTTPQNPLLTELGDETTAKAWAGSHVDGSSSGGPWSECNNWTTDDENEIGSRGNPLSQAFVSFSGGYCNEMNHIYCVEQ